MAMYVDNNGTSEKQNLQQTETENSPSQSKIITIDSNDIESGEETSNLIYLSSVQRYELEWNDLSTIAEDPSLKHLRRVCINGHLKVSKFRSICWGLLLHVLHGNSEGWLKQRRDYRIRYRCIKRKLLLNPHKPTEIKGDNPLSQSQQSVWNQHFCDKELMAVIRQDVVRTFPGVEFFRSSHIQEMMIMILFCYAREYPTICYRQGMHEILAPVLFVLHSDHQALLHINDITNANETLFEVLNPKYMEDDAYFIFSKIMAAIEPFYRIHDIVPSASGYFPVAPPSSPEEHSRSELEVVGQLNFIRDKILAKEDLHLHNHLLKLDIPLPIFGIRWLRLLFGREFSLQELLVLWDAIFADGDSFELTNFIVVAMLIRIRDKLLTSDYTSCLTYLMKYPGSADISLIIRHALYMKSPQLYERPPDAFVYVSTVHPRSELLLTNNKASTLPRNNSTKPVNLMRNNRPHTNSHDETKVKLTSISKQQSYEEQQCKLRDKYKEEKIQSHINTIQTSAALATIKLASNSNIPSEENHGVQDGYKEDSVEVLKMQLQNSQTLMSISRLKLSQYLVTLRKHIPRHSADEVHQALDGIEELCALLRTKFSTPYTVPVPVDAAIEANEAAAHHQRNSQTTTIPKTIISTPSISTTITPIETNGRRQHLSESEVRTRFVQQLTNEPMYEIVATEDLTIDIKAINPPPSSSSSSSHSSGSINDGRRTRYEIPDEQIGRLATKILGDRRELEMHEFRLREKCMEDLDFTHCPMEDPSGDRDSFYE